MVETSIFIGDLLNRIGSRRDVHLSIPGEQYSTEIITIVGDIECTLIVESVSHGIVVHGALNAQYNAQCSYGLVEMSNSIVANVNELFEERAHKADRLRAQADDEETYWFSGDELDISDLVKDSVIMNLPIAPVCSHGPENCTICSVQIKPFINDLGEFEPELSDGERDAGIKKDPRWSALDDLKLDE